MLQISVSTSPRLTPRSPSSVMSASPITAATAANRLFFPGRRRLMPQLIKGTRMTYSVVIKAFLLAVVYFSP